MLVPVVAGLALVAIVAATGSGADKEAIDVADAAGTSTTTEQPTTTVATATSTTSTTTTTPPTTTAAVPETAPPTTKPPKAPPTTAAPKPKKAPAPVPAAPAPAASKCSPNYSGCVPIASDVDCFGGSGNGPAFVQGTVRVIGADIYDLDRDNDGVGCE